VDDDGDLDLVAGNYTQLNRLYRRVLYHTAHGRAGSLRVDTEISNITNATLTATASLPLGENGRAPVGNTRVTYYLSNNGGARWFQVRSGVNFIFPTVGADLRWRADLGSLSPVRTPRVDQIEIDQTPLAVTLADFSAQAQPGQVLVTWETVSELNNQGFNLYRNTAPDPVGSLLAYVPSQAPGSAQGYAYSYVDGDVQPGQTYWYWLEDIDFSGATTLHGPVSVTTQTPTAVRLGELEAGSTTAPTPGWIPALLAALLVFSVAAWDMRRRTRPPNPDNGRA
jgi:hypothetical protein